MKNKAKKKQKGKIHTVTIQSHFGFNMDPNKQLILSLLARGGRLLWLGVATL